MKAEDTVIKPERLIAIQKEQEAAGSYDNPRLPLSLAVALEQAEITGKIMHDEGFKAGMKHGIWLFAWWKDGVQYVGTSGRTLQEAYKELGIE